ncbi:F-box/LRR-repeat protein 6 [Strongylocentrotus purpuratus]|uniref:F-box/LRR-repeat protein 6 n=1 Tax=Strongylocentrotus purpuratus TaxID=7668 RepID=A0A7M7N8J3_STRPU|nr:F-box/LRR-repeat protein 6 [Strongylocentrotus purpuratus]XP_030832720.1 F-box/LRR-repeat protein 6 [Strongylocentrotus purpuratus]
MVEDIPRSSDSDVSEEGTSLGKRKRKSKTPKINEREKPKKSKSHMKKKKKASERTSEGRASVEKTVKRRTIVESGRDITAVGEGDDLWGQRLPVIVLERVIFFAVCETGVVPLLCRVSKVCRLWREAAKASCLWHHVALDNGRVKATDATLEWLTANRIPPQLKTINLNSWTKLTDRSFVALVEACSNIQNISVQKCAKLTNRSIYAIKDHCPNLKELDLGFSGSSLASSPSVRDLLKERGGTLEGLQLAGCSIISSAHLMSSIKSFCHNLRLLDLSNCHVTIDCLMLPIEEMQKGCPLLEILRLAGIRVQPANASAKAQREAEGFSKLKELSLAVADNVAWQVVLPTNLGISDDFLRRVLRNSPYLKLLDLRGCTLIKVETLQDLNVENLEQLYISRCSFTRSQGFDGMISSKWSHSLIELDISWNNYFESCRDEFMKSLSSAHHLRTLDLSGTSVTVNGVRSILKGCTALVSLKLTSCRSLPRGCKRCYEGKSLRKLLKELQNVNDADGDD